MIAKKKIITKVLINEMYQTIINNLFYYLFIYQLFDIFSFSKLCISIDMYKFFHH